MNAILNSLVVSIPLAFAVWITLRVSRRWLNAATRYGVWWIVLAAVIIRRVPAAVTSVLPPSRPAPLPAPTHARRLRPVKLSPGIWSVLLVQVWALAAILMALRLAISYAMLHRRKTRAVEASDGLTGFVETSLAKLGTRRRVRVAVVDDAVSPMMAGPFRPTILLPSSMLAAMQHPEIEQICLHKAAHVARYDDWALLIQRLIETIFVLHPLVRWISKQIHLEREIACDDVVISMTGLARPYAAS
jgi:beta-lactamase regulating signal transducer with metallopeptidase domain